MIIAVNRWVSAIDGKDQIIILIQIGYGSHHIAHCCACLIIILHVIDEGREERFVGITCRVCGK